MEPTIEPRYTDSARQIAQLLQDAPAAFMVIGEVFGRHYGDDQDLRIGNLRQGMAVMVQMHHQVVHDDEIRYHPLGVHMGLCFEEGCRSTTSRNRTHRNSTSNHGKLLKIIDISKLPSIGVLPLSVPPSILPLFR